MHCFCFKYAIDTNATWDDDFRFKVKGSAFCFNVYHYSESTILYAHLYNQFMGGWTHLRSGSSYFSTVVTVRIPPPDYHLPGGIFLMESSATSTYLMIPILYYLHDGSLGNETLNPRSTDHEQTALADTATVTSVLNTKSMNS